MQLLLHFSMLPRFHFRKNACDAACSARGGSSSSHVGRFVSQRALFESPERANAHAHELKRPRLRAYTLPLHPINNTCARLGVVHLSPHRRTHSSTSSPSRSLQAAAPKPCLSGAASDFKLRTRWSSAAELLRLRRRSSWAPSSPTSFGQWRPRLPPSWWWRRPAPAGCSSPARRSLPTRSCTTASSARPALPPPPPHLLSSPTGRVMILLSDRNVQIKDGATSFACRAR